MTDTRSPCILALLDDRIGNRNQVLGVAEKLDLPFDTLDITYTPLAKLPNILRKGCLLGINEKHALTDITPPDIIICAGRRSAPVALHLKKQYANRPFIVQIMHPNMPLSAFGLVAIPAHDRPAKASNIISTSGAPHRITPQRLEQESLQWQGKLAPFATPRVGLLVGGSAGKKHFNTGHAETLAARASNITRSANGSLLVTTSRRTGNAPTKALKDALTVPNFFYNWKPRGNNPYFALLGMSDILIVTGDSISMCSEACASGKPVYIYAPEDITPEKHRRFHEVLYTKGYARPLTGEPSSWQPKAPLDMAQVIAEEIRERAL